MKTDLLKNKIIKWGEELGFDQVGFTDIDLKRRRSKFIELVKK